MSKINNLEIKRQCDCCDREFPSVFKTIEEEDDLELGFNPYEENKIDGVYILVLTGLCDDCYTNKENIDDADKLIG